mmetsp:Transcript_112296/g.177540  ORF Transcript_112296/g.177540 Transcript_112296/m.177540 type:complete len:254 (+) Transcript_112296:69-830(+)
MVSGSLGLRYPSALDLPSTHSDASLLEQPQLGLPGVSIDRKVFRKVRRSGRSKTSEDVPEPLWRLQDEGYHSEGEEGSEWPWIDGEGRQEHGHAEDIDVLGLDALLGSFPVDPDVEENRRHHPVNQMHLRRPCSAPASGRYSNGGRLGMASPSQRIGAPWQPSPQRKGPAKKDPVSRGAQMRNLWSRDRFLRESGRKKFDLRGCGQSKQDLMWKQAAHIPPQWLLPSYVPPHEKRRHSLRNQVHQQMLIADSA